MNDRIRVTQTGPNGELYLSGLQPQEVEQVQAMAYGHTWCLVVNGRLQTQSRWEPLPAPAQDETMMPFWQPSVPGHTQLELQGVEVPLGAQVGVMIQDLCGHHYSPENYKKEVENLESFGFVCLRSRRGADGRFREMWYLSDFWSSQGALKKVVEGMKGVREQVDAAVHFLCRNSSFGSLNVFWQRAAMVIDD